MTEFLINLLFIFSTANTSIGSKVVHCHQLARAVNRKAGGKIQFSVRTRSKGEVVALSIARTSVKSAAMIKCLKHEISKHTWSKKSTTFLLKMNFSKKLPQQTVRSSHLPITTLEKGAAGYRPLINRQNTGLDKVSVNLLRIKKGKEIRLLFNKRLIMGVVIEGNGSLEWKNPSGISKNNFLAISAGTFYSVDKRTVHLLKNDSRSKLLVIALFHYPGLKGKQLKSFLLTKKQSSSKKKNNSKSGLKKLIQHGDINFSLLKKKKNFQKKVLNLGKKGILGVIKLEKGKKLEFKTGDRSWVAGFALQAAGNLIVGREKHQLYPGSGFIFKKKAVYKPAVNKIPLFLLYYSTSSRLKLSSP
ncbi:MAG: hypothetical protein PF689_02865 [Deltaproteobacteria bacterium]|nr:hypothetical protein [Deltaproteobacteria bacterium]